MGFQDRGYYRSPTSGFAPEWSAVNAIIAINVAVWLANFILAGNLLREVVSVNFSLNNFCCLQSDLPSHLWKFWTLLTYGFLHDDRSPWHILFNMLTLWFFGRPIEAVLGRAEFTRFYCVSIIVAGLAWLIGERLTGGMMDNSRLVGASGGVMAVLAAFIWYYPRQTVLIYGILPVPAWALGVLYLFSDLQGAGSQASDVAHVAHLAGAAFGILYVWRGWRLDGLAESWDRIRQSIRTRRLRVFSPDDEAGRRFGSDDDEPPLEEEVDRILEKIGRSGEASLTEGERETLARASRRFKGRRG
ncbi:MAG: rhomboid family intramembrane serine protease [Planctomycetota bacterium]|jgi:membrane associated rhomboid family serine protease|nr:rhomboid family intramembrane serine protease [Pirellulales bacterium]MDA1200143.1 rhomboid family intramembrane serine protease [Planctomycetota bacterium]